MATERKETTPQAEFPSRIYPIGFNGQFKVHVLEAIERFKQNQQRSELEVKLRHVIDYLEPQLATGDDMGDFQRLFDLAHEFDEYLQVTDRRTDAVAEFINRVLTTEEEIAVTFAQASRKPSSFAENALNVTEESAAEFHKKWTVSFEGYGHASVAEHAIIHLAVEHFSSLAVDEITDNRLASFTEQSARFQIIPPRYYFIPEAIRRNPKLLRIYTEAQDGVVNAYEQLMKRGSEYIFSVRSLFVHPERRQQEGESNGVWRQRLQKIVKDSFKNLMTAARFSNVGVTFNAREAEHAISKLLSSDNEEVRALGEWMKKEGQKVAPTLVRYAQPSPYLIATREAREEIGPRIASDGPWPIEKEDQHTTRLLDFTPDADDRFLAMFLYDTTGSLYPDLHDQIARMSPLEKEAIIQRAFDQLGPHDALIREAEFAASYLYELLCSWGSLRDIKRHRMMSYKFKPLGIDYGYVVPELAYEMGEVFPGTVTLFQGAIERTHTTFEQVYAHYPELAHYSVTRTEIRPTVVQLNFRQNRYFVKLRGGPTVHPHVQQVARSMGRQAQEVHPFLWRHIKLVHI